ncbi:unnamed protein product [Adineta ricciae]|uniref:Uncharacterized protein n=1 Tax=Adineta ricciae TaxID=249248 RepID=A0A815GSY4_ADIRI|nr:unnamed protein product [Adineta ricciae]CAF1342534.1 unnamed protein product [Adineta ricciae]
MHTYMLFMSAFVCSFSLTTSLVLSPCAKWNTTGIVIAGTGERGNKSDQLTDPRSIFFLKQTQTLYVVDSGNNRIQKFSIGSPSKIGVTVISNVQYVTDIYVDYENNKPAIYLSLAGEQRIRKWIEGESDGVPAGGPCPLCEGVWVDKEKNVYMSSASRHCVYKWSPETNIPIVVAGKEDYSGSSSNNLNSPEGVYVDSIRNAIYVADYGNNRVQKWVIGASNGTTIAGLSSGEAGSDKESLNRPTSVWVDDETQVIYVADSQNQRIQRWLYNSSIGETIAGGLGTGDKLTQFDQPDDIAFDNDGNLYVCDRFNERVMMFSIIDNQSCFPSSTNRLNSLPFIIFITMVLTFFYQ